MEELRIQIPKGYEIDLDMSRLVDGIVKFKEVKKKTFIEYLPNRIDGYSISSSGYSYRNEPSNFYGMFRTELQCKSAIAYAKLTQLMCLPEYNGDWKPDFTDGEDRIAINHHGIYDLIRLESNRRFSFLPFKSLEVAEMFLANHRELIEEFYQMDLKTK